MRAKRTDANHAEIRKAIRDSGRMCYDSSRFGSGFPDLIAVTKGGRVFLLFEIKTEDGGQIEPDEATFAAYLVNEQYRIVTSAEQAIQILEDEESHE